MPLIYLQLLFITIITALACVIPGNFLILRGNALMSDALSHAILFGIVIMFLIIQDINSPYIFLGAIGAGIFTVTATQGLTHFSNLHQDAAIGLTFPFLFSIAVILINLYTDNVHLDTDAILLGELAFSPFEKLYILNYDCGPTALWSMTFILMLNIFCISYFYKELTLTTFDTIHAKLIGYRPILFHYLLMILTSITIVQAFHTTGTILVISFIITPAATAFLMNQKLIHIIISSCLLAIIGVLAGFLFAQIFDTSIAASITVMNGIIFFYIFLHKILFDTIIRPKK